MPVTLKLAPPRNLVYHGIGGVLLVLNKIRHSIFGYVTPRTFPITEFERAIRYDLGVVDHWVDTLTEYSGNTSSLRGKSILELGPGADLGVGIIFLMKGANKYNAIDVNNLVKFVPDQFYEEFFNYIEHAMTDMEVSIDYLRSQLRSTQAGENDKLNYHCRKDFDVSIFKGEEIDFVFSQAAFEHFDSVGKTVSQLNRVVKSGAILIAEVDLKTHTRWIRDSDPLNICRYSDFFYNLLKFRGSPNRLRPYEYTELLERNGWGKIQIFPLTVLGKDYILQVQDTLNRRFRDPVNQMQLLSVMICETKC